MTGERVLYIPVKWLVPAIMVTVLSPIFSVIAAVKIQERNAAEADRKAAAAVAAQREESRKAYCSFFARILAGYEEDPPRSTAGQNVANAWRDLYKLANCQPPR